MVPGWVWFVVLGAVGLSGCSRASEYRSDCEAGDPLKCYYLGDLYVKGLEVPKDPKLAARYIEEACVEGLAWACPTIGSMYESGEGVEKSYDKARGYYLKACAKPDDEGCRKAFALFNNTCQQSGKVGACDDLAGMLNDGVTAPPDRVKASDLSRRTCAEGSNAGCVRLKESCDANVVEACDHLGQLHEQGMGMPKDRQLAAAWYMRACDRKHAPSCEGLQRMLGTACKGGEVAACLEVAELHLVGPEAVRSEDRALMFLSDACGAGSQDACDRMAGFYERRCEAGARDTCVELAHIYARGLHNLPKNPNRALVLYQNACTNGSMSACSEQAELISRGGDGVTANPSRAAELWEHACVNEFTPACGKLAAVQREACNKNDAQACFQLGQLVESGRGVMQNDQQSAMLYTKACKGGYNAACASMGKLYLAGRGVPVDAKRAAALYQQACQGGHTAACPEAQRLNGSAPTIIIAPANP